MFGNHRIINILNVLFPIFERVFHNLFTLATVCDLLFYLRNDVTIFI